MRECDVGNIFSGNNYVVKLTFFRVLLRMWCTELLRSRGRYSVGRRECVEHNGILYVFFAHSFEFWMEVCGGSAIATTRSRSTDSGECICRFGNLIFATIGNFAMMIFPQQYST